MLLWPRRTRATPVAEAFLLSRLDAKRAGADAVVSRLELEATRAKIAATRADRVRAHVAADAVADEGATKAAIDRAIVTETAEAFNAGIVAEARASADELDLTLEKVWRSEGDACPDCADLDGTSVPLSEDFPEGEPGSIHPNCRCVTEIRKA